MKSRAGFGAPAWRAAALFGVALLLLSGVVGGLLRAGVALPLPPQGEWLGRAVVGHAFLMVCGFLGTVIGFERAVALDTRSAFAAPALSTLGGMATLLGMPSAAAWLVLFASLAFVQVNVVILSRQKAPHTVLLLVGAAAWYIGNLSSVLGARPATVIPWWLTFLVLTVAAERLEMTRLMRARRGSAAALYGCVALTLSGAATFGIAPDWGAWPYGLSLLGLAIWLVRYDVVRRTLATRGLPRYMAVCLLLGYFWLGVAGVSWIGATRGYPVRDAALHALGLGFLFSMVLGHAPVILPAVLRVRLQFGWFFYVPLALLHVSLAVRLLVEPFRPGMLSIGAAGNAAAIGLAAATLLSATVLWRMDPPASSREPHERLARR